MNSIQDRPAALGNFSHGRKRKIDMLVIHVMEGTFGPTAAWFANPEAHVSAHYGISVDGDVARYVRESDTAWHAGHPDYNARSIGIELEGHIADGAETFTEPMINTLAELCEQICSQWGIPRDRAHIIGHNEVPDPRHPGQLGGAGHHQDPGPAFPWDRLISALNRKAVV